MMKNALLKWGTLLLVIAFMASCTPKEKAAEQEDVTTTDWYSVKQLAEGFWLINDNNQDNIYLLEGDSSALLVDTGIGAARLDKVVDSLTSKPLMVVNTHGHPDHAGGNFLFDSIYAHPADFESIHYYFTEEGSAHTKGSIPKDIVISEKYALDSTLVRASGVLVPVAEGHVFDLGGRQLQVVELPGHTPGEICLLDSANKFMITGDNNNTTSWLFLPGCLPLESYRATLEKQKSMTPMFETIYPGHGGSLDIAFIDEQIACVDLILKGEGEPEKAETFMGPQVQRTYKRASIVYDPNNLVAKK